MGAFIAPRNVDETIAAYHGHFEPSPWLERPHVNLALFAVCAETEGRARALASSMEAWFVQTSIRKMNLPFPPSRDARSMNYDTRELAELDAQRGGGIAGTPDHVAAQLQGLVADGRIHELTLFTVAEDFASRLRSYQLIAEACGIGGAS